MIVCFEVTSNTNSTKCSWTASYSLDPRKYTACLTIINKNKSGMKRHGQQPFSNISSPEQLCDYATQFVDIPQMFRHLNGTNGISKVPPFRLVCELSRFP